MSLFGTLADDRALSNFVQRFLGALNNVAVISDLFDLADNAAVSDDLVVDLKSRDHFLKLCLLLLLRHYHQEIEDRKDERERQNGPDNAAASATRGVLKE